MGTLVSERNTGSVEVDEPPLNTREDVRAWSQWAAEKVEPERRRTHPRVLNDNGQRTETPLPLFSTSRREIGRQYGAGVELYFDLLGLGLKTCLLGLAVYVYSLYLNVVRLADPEQEGSGEWVGGAPKVFSTAVREAINDHDWFGVLPLRLTLTSSGARLRCDDAACRWANTITAAIDVLGSLLLLWHAERVLHRHVVAVARRVDVTRVTLADYSVELTGLEPSATPEEVASLVHERLQSHAAERRAKLERREAKLHGKPMEQVRTELRLLQQQLRQCRRFVESERWRSSVVLCKRNGAQLERARKKVPLMRIDSHRISRRTSPPPHISARCR